MQQCPAVLGAGTGDRGASDRVDHIAQRIHRLTAILVNGLQSKGISTVNAQFFDTITIAVTAAQRAAKIPA